uniref:hypothetical protein n=1 Tax=Natronorubrum halophilum TaxID=1702106 RepID=UPI000EF678B8
METVNPHLEGLKPFFDQIPLDVVELIIQFQSGKGSQIFATIDEGHRVVEIAFLGQSIQERSGLTDALPSEYCDTENET